MTEGCSYDDETSVPMLRDLVASCEAQIGFTTELRERKRSAEDVDRRTTIEAAKRRNQPADTLDSMLEQVAITAIDEVEVMLQMTSCEIWAGTTITDMVVNRAPTRGTGAAATRTHATTTRNSIGINEQLIGA
eukprot:TRINITY_DN74456_c0_g1_i1.p2 TRINITY_DN74456_c0_g1~~TRINITY_DN74456_c0_g1_i1.p2  ORF type:complete len:149 (+),score=23.66 TRINITY_DN74456_c0_g1_i1:51-449(+)